MDVCSRVFFKDAATTEIYPYGHTLSLHDALPIFESREGLIPPVIDESDDGEGGFLSDAGDHYRADYDTDALPATSGAATTPSSPNSDSADLSGADAASDEEVVKKIEVNSLNNPTKETISYLTSQVSAALKLRSEERRVGKECVSTCRSQ